MARYEAVTTPARFMQLRRPWGELCRDSNASPFQSHEWLAANVSILPGAAVLEVATLSVADRLVAALPLVVHRRHGVRFLEFIGQPYSDYCDGIGSHDHVESLWGSVIGSGRFDVLQLDNVRPDAVSARALDARRIEHASGQVCYSLDARGLTGDEWLKQCSAKARNAYTRGCRRIIDQGGDYSFEMFDRAPPRIVDAFRFFQKAWFEERGLPSTFVDALPALLGAWQESGALRLAVIQSGGEMVAASINIAMGEVLGGWVTTYNRAFARCGPGGVLLSEVTRWAFDHGFTLFDYMRGEEPYKERSANGTLVLRRYTEPVTIRGRIALRLRDLRRLGARRSSSDH